MAEEKKEIMIEDLVFRGYKRPDQRCNVNGIIPFVYGKI